MLRFLSALLAPRWTSPRRLSRSHRESLLVSILLLSAFIGMGVYILAALQGNQALRERNALYRITQATELYSKIISSDVSDSVKVINSLQRRFFQTTIQLSLAQKAALTQFCQVSPRLYQASIVSRDGKCLYSTDPELAPFLEQSWKEPGKGVDQNFPQLKSLKNIPTFFTPIPKEHPQGYLVTSFRPEGFSLWLLNLQITGTHVFIVRKDGMVIVATNRDMGRRPIPLSYEPLYRAQRGQAGALVDTFLAAPALVGFTPIPQTQWCLLVVQKLEDTYNDEDYPILSLTRATAPFLLFLPFAAWLTLNRYHHQLRRTQELAFRNERLDLADRAKSDLLANVSHDLKTPLSSLQLTIARLREPTVVEHPEHVTECARVLEIDLGRLTSKVRNLLDMSRLEYGVLGNKDALCELSEVVSDVLERLNPLLKAHPLVVNFPPEALFIECEAELLATVLMNLLENGAKYAPPGTPLVLSAIADAQNICILVRDQGPGIPKELHPFLFERFYRVPGQKAHGTGLGLAICKTIVEAQGGQIAVTTPVEGGGEFIVTLPRYQEGETQ